MPLVVKATPTTKSGGKWLTRAPRKAKKLHKAIVSIAKKKADVDTMLDYYLLKLINFTRM
jgi:hypothetical protein